MDDTDTPKAQPLTAEEEAEWRAVAANNRGSLPGKKRPGANFLRRLFATLDSARAEAERLRQERDVLRLAVDSAALLIRQRDSARARIEALEAGLRNLNAHIEKMQDRVIDYLKPYGTGTQRFISGLIYDLDGPEQRAVQKAARALLTPVEAPSDVHPQGE